MTTPTRFPTLLLREWLQHKRGWLITLLLPPLLFLAILPFGHVDGLPIDTPLFAALTIVMMTSIAMFGISYGFALFQLPGLARRDQQDRSIEFWLSLPGGHGESIGATLLAHAVIVPLVAEVAGIVFGGVIASGMIVKQAGWIGWSAVPWLSVFGMALPLMLRGLFGTLLMTLWLAPLILIVMAASAWLKRWGVPAVIIGIGAGGLLLDKLYGNTIVWDLLKAQWKGSEQSFLADPKLLHQFNDQFMQNQGAAFSTSAWAWHDALVGVQNLASPNLVGGLVVAAGCFALLVLKRGRAA